MADALSLFMQQQEQNRIQGAGAIDRAQIQKQVEELKERGNAHLSQPGSVDAGTPANAMDVQTPEPSKDPDGQVDGRLNILEVNVTLLKDALADCERLVLPPQDDKAAQEQKDERVGPAFGREIERTIINMIKKVNQAVEYANLAHQRQAVIVSTLKKLYEPAVAWGVAELNDAERKLLGIAASGSTENGGTTPVADASANPATTGEPTAGNQSLA